MKITTPGRVIWLVVFILISLISQQTFAQPTLKKLEYAFDTDPGTNNGTAINVAAVQTLDNVFSFDVSALANGIHLIHYRVQDSDNKWSLTQTASFLKLGGNNNGPIILKKLEYAFDTDPGMGNATGVNLTAVASLDSLFTFPVNNLADGIHILYYRVQDADNKWSLTQTTSFLKFGGNNNGSAITQLEYFVDADPGFGNGTQLTFTPGNNISDTFSFVIPANGSPKRKLYIRAKDNIGAWSLLYSQEVDACQFKVQPEFWYVQFGNHYSFTDSSKGTVGNNYKWKFFNNNIQVATSTLSHPQIDLPPGLNKVRLIRGGSCQSDSVEHSITTGKISSYYPNSSLAGGDIIVALYGAGLDTSAKVFLKQTSSPANFLVPVKKASKSQYQLTTYFDLHNVTATGAYFIEVVFSNGQKDTVGYRIDPADVTEPSCTVKIDGPSNVRDDVFTTFNITITNTSNKLIVGVPFSVVIPVTAIIDFSAIPASIPTGYLQAVMDSMPAFTRIDSIFGKPYAGKIYTIWLSGINAKQSVTVPVRVKSFTGFTPNFNMYAYTSKKIYGSILSHLWGKCFDDIFLTTLGVLPVIGCGASAFDFLSNTVDQVATGEQHFSSWGNFGWGMGSALFSCIPVLGNASKVQKLVVMADRLNRSKKYFKAGLALGGYNGSNAAAGDCFYVEDQDPDSKPIQTSAPRDPNAIYGATGYGTQQYLNSASGKLGYTVHFENVATATASAQKVTVTDTLDKTKFDLANFHLVNFSIGDSLYTMPPALQQFTRIVKIKQFSNVNVLFNAKLDTATGILTCTYMSVDPLTNELVDEASLLGFLPPNTSNAKGEGSVSYAVPLKRLASGTVVPNRAGIVFDRYASIITNTWTNTLDTTKPANTVLTTQRVNDTTMRLSFNSSDAHSGMQRYDVFASTNNGPYIYAGSITDTARLIGKVDSTYSFYGVPADNVGNLGSISNIAIVKLTGATTTQSDKLLVYPNPVHRSATIVFSVVQQQTVAVKLYSMTGQLVASLYEGAASGSVRLTPDFSHLGNGVYILKVKGASGLQLQTKIIIQH